VGFFVDFDLLLEHARVAFPPYRRGRCDWPPTIETHLHQRIDGLRFRVKGHWPPTIETHLHQRIDGLRFRVKGHWPPTIE